MCVTYRVKLPVAAALPLTGSGTYVIHMCSDVFFGFVFGLGFFFFGVNCGENQCNTIWGEANGLCLTEDEMKFRTFNFSFPISSPSVFSTPNFQRLSLWLSLFVPC